MARSTSTVAAKRAAKRTASKPSASKAPAVPAPSTAEARSLVTEAVSAWNAHTEADRMVVTPLAARATYAAKQSGLLGGGEGSVYTNETFVALFGLKAKSMASRWLLLGICIAEKGVEVGSPLWLDLLAGNKVSGIAAEIKRTGSTQASIKRALKAMYLPDGRKRGSGESQGSGRSARTGSGEDADTATRLSSAQVIDAAIKSIAEHAPNLTADEASAIEDRLNHLIASMVADRTARATDARRSARLVNVAQTG